MEKESLFRQAKELISSRDYKGAGDILARLIEICGSEDINILVAIENFYDYTGDFEMRLRVADKLLSFDGADFGKLLPYKAHYLSKLKRYKEALKLCEEYLEGFGQNAMIYEVMAGIHQKLGNFKDEALFFEKLISNVSAFDGKMIYYSNLVTLQSYAHVYDHERYRDLLEQIYKATKPLAREIAPDGGGYFKKLKVAYLSPDFRNHPIGFFIYPLVLQTPEHEHAIHCFSLYPPEKKPYKNMFGIDIAAGLKTRGKYSVIEHMTDERMERTVMREKPDIAFDLSNHTEGNKLRLFAARLAPIQITYLGWPTSSGIAAMDYVLVDANTDPEGAEKFYTEKLIRMSKTSLCHTLVPVAEPLGEPPVKQNGYITFGCFCNPRKMTPTTLGLIASVLNELKTSRLLLMGRYSPDTLDYMREKLTRAGAPIERISIEPANYGSDYPESYNRVDIILDTYPFNGATTTCDALNMGVPVVTMAGEAQAARRGLSILRNAGLEELITCSEDEYVRTALELAGDAERIADYRRNLRGQKSRSSLADAEAFANEFACQIRRVWIDCCREHNIPDADYSKKTDAELADELLNARRYIAYDKSVTEEYARLENECARRGICEVKP